METKLQEFTITESHEILLSVRLLASQDALDPPRKASAGRTFRCIRRIQLGTRHPNITTVTYYYCLSGVHLP